MSVNPVRLIKAPLLGKERTLLRILLLSFPLLKLSFCFPACHSRGRRFREREREGEIFHETDGKLSVRLCFERVLRDCIPVNRIFPSVLVSWKSKFVWEAKERKWDRFFFFGVENSF